MAERARAWIPLVLAGLVGCGPTPDGEDVVMTSVTPTTAVGWSADGDEQLYDTESIYAYIDGHAEVYLAYGMKRCVSRRYVAPDGDGEIIVDLFEMASPADAFGVFSHDRDGETVAIGQGGIYRLGWLSFWSGSWYGSIYATGIEDGARDAIVEVADVVAENLPADGRIPALVNRLPSAGLDPSSVCFLRSPQILDAHVFVGGDNLLALGPEVEAVVGRYRLEGSPLHLVVVEYPDEGMAAAVEQSAREMAGSGAERHEMTLVRDGDLVALVISDEQGELGRELLEHVIGGAS